MTGCFVSSERSSARLRRPPTWRRPSWTKGCSRIRELSFLSTIFFRFAWPCWSPSSLPLIRLRASNSLLKDCDCTKWRMAISASSNSWTVSGVQQSSTPLLSASGVLTLTLAWPWSRFAAGLARLLVSIHFCNTFLILRNTATDNFRRYQLEWYSINLLTDAAESSFTILLAETTFLTSGLSSGTSPTGKGCWGHSVSNFHKKCGPLAALLLQKAYSREPSWGVVFQIAIGVYESPLLRTREVPDQLHTICHEYLESLLLVSYVQENRCRVGVIDDSLRLNLKLFIEHLSHADRNSCCG